MESGHVEINNFFEWLERAGEITHNAQVATALIKCRSFIKDELVDLHEVSNTVKDRILQARQALQRRKQLYAQLSKLITLLKDFDKKIIYMTENVLPQLIQNSNKQLNSDRVQEPTSAMKNHTVNGSAKKMICFTPSVMNTPIPMYQRESELRNCKKILFNESEMLPIIAYLTEEEFNNIPKYIIGRHTLETINSLIDKLNMILKSKYTLLSSGKNDARKKGELNLYLHYRRQQTSVCQNGERMYFFNGDDYYRITKMKLDKTTLNLFTALRHCKRLREFRQGKDLQYVII